VFCGFVTGVLPKEFITELGAKATALVLLLLLVWSWV